MKIQTTILDDTLPAPPVKCAHCDAPVSGACSLVLHVLDNPEHGRPQINTFTVFQFCGTDCRAAWWETPASEPCFHDHGPVTSQCGHPLSALVIHNDHDTRHPISITTDEGHLLAEHMGVVAAHHVFDDPPHIERWWNGEAEVAPMEIPMKEEVSGG